MLKFILLGFLSSFVLWLFFTTVMALKRRQELQRLPKVLYILGRFVILPLGAIVDAAYNQTIAIFLFWDLPQELLLTARLQRYLYVPEYAGTWRRKLADWICKYLIEPNDFGHCRK